MLEVLDIPDVRERIAPITIERYHRMIELGVFDDWNVELLNGALVEKTSKSQLHVYLVRLLFQMLTRFCPDSLLVMKEDPITIENSEPEPDISVLQGTLADFRTHKPTTARLVIEVAITTVGVDRAKATDYAKASIPEFWLIRPEARVTEIYRKPTAGHYTENEEVAAESDLRSTALPGFTFNLADALKE